MPKATTLTFFVCVLILFSCASMGLSLLNIIELEQGWLLYTNGPRLDEIARTNLTPVIIDYSADGSEQKRFKKEDLMPLKRMRDGSVREVLAYVNVGIAERWRWYWLSLPKTIIYGPLEGWEGEYYVKFWTDEWVSVILKYIEKIVDAGFDGVLFDWVNIYFSSSLQRYSKFSAVQLRHLMVQTLNRIMEKFPNLVYAFVNGEDILTSYSELREKVKYVVVEDLFFTANNQLATDTKVFMERLEKLLKLKSYGISVLSVEYIDNQNPFDAENVKRMKTYIELARQHGFKHYVANVDRRLNEINVPRIVAR